MKYKKKILEVEAIKISEVFSLITGNKWDKLPKWVKDHYEAGKLIFASTHVIVELPTCAQLRGSINDWLVYGGEGDVYTCTPEMFEKLYK